MLLLQFFLDFYFILFIYLLLFFFWWFCLHKTCNAVFMFEIFHTQSSTGLKASLALLRVCNFHFTKFEFGMTGKGIYYIPVEAIWRYCTFIPPFFIDDSGAEFHAD